ncbi:hypothetical protein HJG60_009502 [Phyllostomus discolor]|uniref:Uncharacterized protein n=1 Tax=Phyllostomus discolor TaxID=89673 RepID=A0A833YIL6_9CHIR|nr:hypothetical protein HJG60_009502 [Phyllostomus discolor]
MHKQQVLVRMCRKGNPGALLGGMQTGVATVDSDMEIPQKITNATASWPSNFTSGNLSEETQNTGSKEHVHPYVHCSVIIIAKIWKQPKCPLVGEWIEMLHLYNEILLGHKKKKEILPFATARVDLESITLSEISPPEEDKYHMISLVRGIE